MCAALLPLRLADLPARLDALLDHLQKYRRTDRATAREWIHAKYADKFG